MMRLLAPLGLIGLLGVVALIIIYIIKPNYQQKFISSTYVWKLSLKYRKRKLPINKLRNILIIICQILILTLAAFILSRPNSVFEIEPYKTEYILVIDSSASMRTKYEKTSRFDRAIDKAITDAYDIFSEDGIVTVIIADATPEYLTTQIEEDEGIAGPGYVPEVDTFRQVNSSWAMMLEEELLRLKEEDGCSYASSDVDAAMEMCQDLIDDNPTAKVYLYTDTKYNLSDTVTVVPVNHEDEWNAGILSFEALEDDYYYMFAVDVAYYAHMTDVTDIKSATLEVQLNIENANAYDRNSDDGKAMPPVVFPVRVTSGVPRKVIFKCGAGDNNASDDESSIVYCNLEEFYGDEIKIQTYGSATVKVTRQDSDDDCNILDDKYTIYGSQREVIKLQYASAMPNVFMTAMISTIKSLYSDRWDIQLHEVQKGDDYAMEGYDFYIFEHSMPNLLPADGVVLLVNPDSAPVASNFTVGNEVKGEKDYYLHTEELNKDSKANLVMSGLSLENVTVRQYRQITTQVGYDVLATVNGDPAVMVCNTTSTKMGVIAFSLHYSNLAIRKEWPMLMTNMISYFFPTMLETPNVEVGEDIVMNSMSQMLQVTYPIFVSAEFANSVIVDADKDWYFYDEAGKGENFKVIFEASIPGTYQISQLSYYGKNFTERVFVAIPTIESDIWRTSELTAPVAEQYGTEYFEDWLLYLAAAIVFFLFAEWFLHIRENAL